eukprot:CAMPEP_0195064920 /NCGR_PEP_ID=MMETSP0448-20130528/10743_1 /TAXON_ID=66468 /ORGANISM="Heterocapsa triquestra, Strain CCMP 448" /LENGTH=82 /DNA_ID=CAMNT_0040095965 /DNA_START=79 /DNA_END=327 /DNA_ORIENTATION=-
MHAGTEDCACANAACLARDANGGGKREQRGRECNGSGAKGRSKGERAATEIQVGRGGKGFAAPNPWRRGKMTTVHRLGRTWT